MNFMNELNISQNSLESETFVKIFVSQNTETCSHRFNYPLRYTFKHI